MSDRLLSESLPYQILITDILLVLGLIVGAIIRYAGSTTSTHTHLQVDPSVNVQYNDTLPPDTLWFNVSTDKEYSDKQRNFGSHNRQVLIWTPPNWHYNRVNYVDRL